MKFVTCRLLALLVALALLGVVACDRDDESATDGDESAVQEVETDEESDSSADDVADDADEADETDKSDSSADDGSKDDDEESQDSDGDDEDTDEESAEVEERPVEDFEHLPVYATGVVATIDGEDISAHEFNVAAEAQLAAVPQEMIAGQGEQIKAMFIEAMVSAALIERAVEAQGIEVTPAEIDQAMKEFEELMAQQPGGAQQFAAMMEEQGIDDEMLREQVERELAAEKLVVARGEVNVSDADVRRYYDQNVAAADQEDQTRARHILLHVNDAEGTDEIERVRTKAEQLVEELRGGADFDQLAAEHSDGPNAENGGDLGYFTREQLMPEFTSVAFELPVGDISEPVRTTLGWHIIRVEDRQEAGSTSFEEVEANLRMMLENERLQQAAMELIQQLKSESDVEIFEDHVVVGG